MVRTIGYVTTGEGIRYVINIFSNVGWMNRELPYEYARAVGFDMYLASKSSKRYRGSKEDEARYGLMGYTFNIGTMRAMQAVISYYLNTQKPQLILVTAYWDDALEKRLRFYVIWLARLGYKVVYSNKTEDGWPYHIMERKEV